MPMTKAEKLMVEKLRHQAALRWTSPVLPDLPVPTSGNHTEGWMFNAYSGRVEKTWSEMVAHGSGDYPGRSNRYRSGSQGGIALYSTEALALAAMRHAIERRAATDLMNIDLRLLALQSEA